MQAPDTIFKLVERFNSNIDQYRSPRYNEAQLRTEFANPFFIALGWDVFNEKGYAEAYKEVVHEAVVKVGGATKAPDYSFRIGGTRKFFVETKKPAVNLSVDPLPAFQLRRYAWSAKLPLSILTDFEEFAVYDTRIKPAKNDKASVGRIINLTYCDYTDRWEEIADIFSPTAIRKGSFDKYVESTRKKKGTAEVDDAFLKDIESWRDELARNIALRNPGLSTRELNFAVQRIIDRIIFLRICEDRGIEEYGELQSLLKEADIYSRLVALFNRADERYNSGLFHFNRERGRPQKPDTLTPTLKIDDRVPKEIIKELYYPESPYEFSVLPADILGQVYEQFLGKVIRLTPGHRAVVEEKPEVKKAGGVYYTPTYIVDYIVENTVGKLLEGKTPRQVSKLRILDPACGSGSFLIGAYQKLLDWHQEWYVHPPASGGGGGPEKWRKVLYEGPEGEWRLTTAERRRILLNNIYGVDIDPQAVEVTKLSLLLKVLEGESGEVLNRQLEIFRERALPDLATNIKCGNSLIGPDFYQGKQMSLLSDEERLRINAFDWNEEFKEIMEPRPPADGGAKAGFDAVIGNPPYVRQEGLGEWKEYFKSHYKTYAGTADLYTYFIEKALTKLKQNGYFGYIVSNKWMRARYGEKLRKFVKQYQIEQLINFGELRVFQNAATFPLIVIIRKTEPKVKAIYAPIKRLSFQNLTEEVKNIGYELEDNALSDEGFSLVVNDYQNIIDKMKSIGIPLGDYANGKIYRGGVTGFNKAFIIDKKTRNRLISEDPKSIEILKPIVIGDDVRRYFLHFRDRYLIFAKHGIDIEKYPAILSHLSKWKKELTPKKDREDRYGRAKGNYEWFELQSGVGCHVYFEKPKIIYPDIAKESRFAFDKNGLYVDCTVFIIPLNDYYLLGLLNSKLIWKYLKSLCYVLGDPEKKGRLRLKRIFLVKVPIRTIDFDDPDDVKMHDRMVALVEEMLSLHKKVASARTDHPARAGQRQIDATDGQIDKLVYELYGLSEEEIRVVEGR